MIWSALFFVLLFIAALTSAISLLEVVVAYFKDQMGWGRPKSALVMGIVIFLIGDPSALSLGNENVAIAGKSFLDAMDFISSNVLLPLGGLLISLFVGWIWLDGAKKEVTNDGKLPFGLMWAWVWTCRLIAPAAIAWIFVKGLKW